MNCFNTTIFDPPFVGYTSFISNTINYSHEYFLYTGSYTQVGRISTLPVILNKTILGFISGFIITIKTTLVVIYQSTILHIHKVLQQQQNQMEEIYK